MWNVTNYVDTVPPVAETEAMGLWELGNWVISGVRLTLKINVALRVVAKDIYKGILYHKSQQATGGGSWATGSSQVRA
jgi:hypothetical protein